jgi:Protein of unknown function (DUF993)
MLTLRLPRQGGQLESFTLRDVSQPRLAGKFTCRTAYAAAHVAADPFACVNTAIDWDATLAFRRHLWAHGFAVAEAMDTAQLSLFGGYAIYLPELFPTRLRSTGTSFCYNASCLVAAAGPFTLGALASRMFSNQAEPMRYAVSPCAWSSWWGWRRCLSLRKRRASRCRSEGVSPAPVAAPLLH